MNKAINHKMIDDRDIGNIIIKESKSVCQWHTLFWLSEMMHLV